MKNRLLIGALSISATALITIASNEGYVGETYTDAVGIPTIGFGETNGVKYGQKTDPVRALIQLNASMDEHAKGISKCINVPISQGEYDAYISFSYNVGVNAFCTSTLNKKLNAMDYDGACKELLRWNKAGGKVLNGLTKRREQEYKQCLGL
ncbi:lysozyme [Flavobacterium sp.]|jgi:lysozyme|uniref:lysozyme n=1 Tax=Flavobacterium sp. TaxID=239 RepID=UPI0037BE4315